MNPIYFCSSLNPKYLKDLENLLFFNKNQSKYSSQINNSISKFGVPRIVSSKKNLKIEIEGIEDCQNLFVLDGEIEDSNLLGVLIFYRESKEKIIILHIAVEEECSSNGKYAEEFITLRLILRLKKDISKIKGVKYLYFAYKTISSKLLNIPIRHKTKSTL